MPTVLQINNLTLPASSRIARLFRALPPRRPLIDAITFSIEAGEAVGILGDTESGARAVGYALFDRLSKRSRARELLGISPKQTARHPMVQMLFSDPKSALAPDKTVLYNLGDPLRYHHYVTSHEALIEAVKELLIRIDISPSTWHCYPHQFSEQQQQRLAIGRAISLSPRLLISDDLLAGSERATQASLLSLLRELGETLPLAYLITSSNLSLLSQFCHRLLIMYRGKIVEEGPTLSVIESPKHPYTKWLMCALPTGRALPIPQTSLRKELSRLGCPFFIHCPYAQPGCACYPPPRQQEGNQSYFCIYAKRGVPFNGASLEVTHGCAPAPAHPHSRF